MWDTVKSILYGQQKTNENVSSIKDSNNFLTINLAIFGEFNNYFSSLGTTIANKVFTSPNSSYISCANKISRNTKSLFYNLVNGSIIANLINLLKKSHSNIHDSATNNIQEILSLCDLLHYYISNFQYFLKMFKYSTVVPLCTSEGKLLKNYYRLIAITNNTISKLTEKCIKWTKYIFNPEKYFQEVHR